MPARPENVPVVRHTLTGAALALRLDERTLAGLRLAVTEACTNVVRHAYPGGTGEMEVALDADKHSVTVEVRDTGAGIRPTTSQTLGIGLPLIAGLCDRLRISREEDGANLVAMSFDRRRPAGPYLVG